MNFPNEMSGTHPLAGWCNKLLRAAKASRVSNGIGYKTRIGSDGTILEVDVASRAGVSEPFKIYQTSSWLTYKVTTGYIVRSANPITATGIEADKTLTAGVARYWFYIEMTASAAEIKTSATTLAWSCDKVPIGWVDTLTGQATTTAQIYQLNKDHIFSP